MCTEFGSARHGGGLRLAAAAQFVAGPRRNGRLRRQLAQPVFDPAQHVDQDLTDPGRSSGYQVARARSILDRSDSDGCSRGRSAWWVSSS
jgi:hypothetical protein